MKLIALGGKYGKGKFAKVDDADFEWLSKYGWFVDFHHNHYYAIATIKKKNGKWIPTPMHRLILGVEDPKKLVDHEDNDCLNNQRHNLRIANNSQNLANRKQKKGKFIGVHFNKRCQNFEGYCFKDGKKYTKHFDNAIDAAKFHNEMAVKLHGKFASLNIIE